MKKLTWVFFALISVALFAVSTFASYAPKYLGGSFYETEDFHWTFDNKIEEFGPILINRLDVDESIKQLTVSDMEIENYRTYYGSQVDQIRSVQNQYLELINDAEINNNDVLKEELEKERDGKIDAIRANFADDKVVREKILTAKEDILRKYDAQVSKAESGAKEERNSFAYDLVNLETKERFTYGDVDEPSIYKKTYNKHNGYLPILAISPSHSSFENEELQILSSNDISDMIGFEFAEYEGTITMPKSAKYSEHLLGFNHYERSKGIFIGIWIFGLLAAGAAFWLFKTKRQEIVHFPTIQWINQLKLEGRLTGIFITLIGMLITHDQLTYYLANPQSIGGNYFGDIVFLVIFFMAFTIFTIAQCIWFIKDVKDERHIQLWEDSMIRKLIGTMQDAFANRSLGKQIVALLGIIFLAGLGFGGVILQPMLILVYAPLFVIVVLPTMYTLFKRLADYNKLAIATEKMAKGQFVEDVVIRGKSVLAAHAKHLNTLREGVRMSQSEQAKSERLKTELITNVSHDLRTPLTSIITYTDLLKKPALSEEDRMSYVGVLDRKSQRLKTLIEDLFEVSKMASGNLELHKQRVDLTQLMQQALAEHQEEIQKSELDFRVSTPETSLHAYVDGQRWWRVLDNLIVNAVKYTLSGTRVYVTLKETNGFAEFTVKNITKYELGENVDELFERFKRADTSRHTDGSGLGIAIAQSIVDLHGGSMRIEVDGDLFKVTVTIKTM
ncbi:sensor histidine kinase [Paenisporosarcina indica]|uniref:sensor histidine kinase n=1 Tax=Paenisporosarcina indica TaxID=650093 RepID=UPI0009501825|nr:HAMP domain-containing sensor histidine kinase [Paenisporosarcina indica]